jgi:hypothetical protein
VNALESYHAFCYALRLLLRCQLVRPSCLPGQKPDLVNFLLELACRHRDRWLAARCIGGPALSVEYECAVWPQSADFEGAVWFGWNSREPRNMFRVTEGGRMLRYGCAGCVGSGSLVDDFVEVVQRSREHSRKSSCAGKAVWPVKTRETHHRQRLFLAFDAADSNCRVQI